MPREVKAYACEFKCGRRTVMSKKSMVDHESRCFHNPEKRACASCKHFEKEHDDNGVEGSFYNSWVNLLCHANEDYLFKMQNNCDLYEQK